MAHASVLPSGFRFLPTDCEIMYLLRILLLGNDDDRSKEEIRMSLNVIQRGDVYSIQPWELFNKFDNHQVHIQGDDQSSAGQDSYLYFLTNLKTKTKNGTRVGRTVVVNNPVDQDDDRSSSSLLVGTWKLQTGQIDIIDYYKTGMSLGVKRAFTFQLAPMKKTDKANNDDDQDSCSSSNSKKRKKKEPAADEEMEAGVSYIMHEFTLQDQAGYGLCRIRRKIDKKMINKKMRSSPTTTTTTTTSCSREAVQADQQDQIRATGLYDYHHQEDQGADVHDSMRFDLEIGEELTRQLQEATAEKFKVPGISFEDFMVSSEQQEQQPVVVPVSAEQQTTRGVQQQQEAVVPAEGDAQISDLANKNEDFSLFFNEEFLSLIEQDVAATTGEGLLF